MTFYLKGLIVGLSIAAPVGPIGVLCIRRTLADGRAAGFASGLGAATADAIYGTAAAVGLTAVARVLVGGQPWLRLAGCSSSTLASGRGVPHSRRRQARTAGAACWAHTRPHWCSRWRTP